MRIEISQAALAKAAKFAASAILGKTTLPILSHLHFMPTGDGKLRITGSNLQIWAESTIDVVGSLIPEEGDAGMDDGICFPSGSIIELASRLPSGAMVTITTEGTGNEAKIVSGRVKANVKFLRGEEYALAPVSEPFACCEASGSDLADAIDFTAPCASTCNIKNLQLMSVLITIDKGTAQFVATDTHRLAVRSFPISVSTGSGKILIPAELIRIVSRNIQDAEAVRVELVPGAARFTWGGKSGVEQNRIVALSYDGQYPNWERIVPRDYAQTITFSRADLVDSVERASIYADMGIRVVFDASEDGIVSITSSATHGSFSEDIEVAIGGGTIRRALNAKQLLTCLRSFKTEGIRMSGNMPISPVIIDGVPGDRESVDGEQYCVLTGLHEATQ